MGAEGGVNHIQKMLKGSSIPSKALVIRINLVFLSFFLLIYAALLLLQPSSSAYFDALVRCSLRECRHHKMEKGSMKMEAVFDQEPNKSNNVTTKVELPSFMNEMGRNMKIGMVNMDNQFDLIEWSSIHGSETIPISFSRVSQHFKWSDLFPEWIDEEEETDVPSCPEIPMPNFKMYENLDMIVAKLPCKYPEKGWAREVLRLQIQLIVANLVVKKGKRDWSWRTKVVFWSKCRPMVELFRCNDLVKREDDWWYYQPEMVKLEQKVSLPIGSCKLSLPLWDSQGIDQVYDLSKLQTAAAKKPKREAYATVLHSSEAYVCGAITLAQSLLKTNTNRDLILLLDSSISVPKRHALSSAGWKLRFIKRIRNPRAEKGSYNEYNYSKFRLWQLTNYDKIIFIDSDIIVLRNLDLLFHFPQMSATGNDVWLFNSGIMVIEPSNCTFKLLMKNRNEIVSYNGGDQGFLNEVFVWWHRLPRRVNFLKNFWANTTKEAAVKNELFGAEPPKVYSIHYLGIKPWLCYRDYDCNWDIGDQRVYASDVAHKRWWKLHDGMDEGLQKHCGLNERRRIELDWDRNKAKEIGLSGGYWSINITDPRRTHLIN